MSKIDYQNKLDAFNKLLDANRQYGTGDSEVLRKKSYILKQAYQLEQYIRIPKTAQEWEIYDIKGADALAKQLHDAMAAIVTAIDNLSVAEFKSFIQGKGTEII